MKTSLHHAMSLHMIFVMKATHMKGKAEAVSYWVHEFAHKPIHHSVLKGRQGHLFILSHIEL